MALARAQGDAYGRALEHMIAVVAHDGGEQHAGDYFVGYAVEKAEGMYALDDVGLVWHEPGDANLHVEVAVRDAADGRFVPNLRVTVTLIDPDGEEVGTHEQPLLWHPMIYHYGRNWTVPRDGEYQLRIKIDPPALCATTRSTAGASRTSSRSGSRPCTSVEAPGERPPRSEPRVRRWNLGAYVALEPPPLWIPAADGCARRIRHGRP